MENEKKLILGLDVSTKTIGVCLMLSDGDKNDIIKLTHCSPKVSTKIKGIESLFLKKQIFEDEFLSQYLDLGITDIIIEEALIFGPNANAVAPLIRFNTLVSHSIYKLFNLAPDYLSSYDARAYAFPELLSIRKLNKKGNPYSVKEIKKSIKDNNLVLYGEYAFDISKKDVVFGLVHEIYPDIEYIYDKNNELKKENFDACDATVCCLGYINYKKYGEMTPQIKNVKQDSEYIYYDVEIWDKTYSHKINLQDLS